jgi:hypothetical protein
MDTSSRSPLTPDDGVSGEGETDVTSGVLAAIRALPDRARAAMRAIAGTVNDAPPLRLAAAKDPVRVPDEARPGSRRRGARRPAGASRPRRAPRPWGRGRERRRRWSLLAPIAAAVTIVAVAVTLVTIRDIPNGGVAGPPAATPLAGSSATSGVTATGVPEYYVAWMQADLVVGNTFTGQTIATVGVPAGVFLESVYGTAADDRTFIVTGQRQHGADAGTVWYLLRIAPGSATPARLTPLPIPVRQDPAGAALSPDGTELAVALPGSPATLRVYSVATGALLREWSTTASGELTAEKVPSGAWQFTAMVLRWSSDGRQLAFTWNASAIRILDATAPDGDLITRSELDAGIGTGYGLDGVSTTCNAAQGWQPITVTQGAAAGRGTVCAGSAQFGRPQRNSIGFLLSYGNSHEGTVGLASGSSYCSAQAEPVSGAYIGWANTDGSEVLGSQVCGRQSRFGIFRGSTFTPLPALPNSLPVAAGVMEGTVAW